MLGFAVVVGVGLWTVLAPDRTADLRPPVAHPGDNAAEGKTATGAALRGHVPAPSFDVVRVSREGTGVIAGRAAPGATVNILADDKPLSDVQADQRGDWALIFDNPLPTGGTRLSLSATLPGGAPLLSRDEVILSVPQSPVAKPGAKGPARETFIDPVDEGVVALRVNRGVGKPDGLVASEVLQRPSASADYLSDVTLDVVDYDAAGVTVLNGRGKSRRDVRVYLDNHYLAEIKVGDTGRWIYPVSKRFDDQAHRLRVDQLSDKGVVEARVELGLRLPRTPRAAELKASYAISESKGADGRIWRIAYLRDNDSLGYALVIGPDRSQIRDVKIIYPGQNIDLPGKAMKHDTGY